jgi:hypothetical protein
MSAPARDGWADVAPASGIALETRFVLTASGWTADADELPLTYKADYFVEGLPDAPVVSLTGGAFQTSPVVAALLPAGNITLRVTARSASGATATATVAVQVAWPSLASAAEVDAFVGDKAALALRNVQSGDSSTALQLVGGLATLLNGNASSTAAATTQRASLLAVVASAVNQSVAATAGSPGAVASTAALVAQLLASPTQLSAEASASALPVLSVLAGRGADVSPAAAQSVADALNSVATAPASGDPALSSVLDVLGVLAASQATSLAVPGQAALAVRTDAIQMAIGLDDPAAGRLFNAPLSAPGSASTFDPLPAGTLTAAGGAAVNTLFLSLAFDAHGGRGSNNTGGLTRLAFSTPGGAAVAVVNRSTPLTFTVPASALGGSQLASCSWWDDAAGIYTTAGCAAQPSPAPPDHVLSFEPSFVASGPASLAAAWRINGTLLSGCELTFLDCTNATSRIGKLQLDPASPFAAPLVGCGNSTDVVLRAYVGSACALRNASNAYACAWDAITQSFTGTGCVAANATRCACSHLTDFTSSPAPRIPVCSLNDLVGLNPADLVTKLKFLFIVVITLFGSVSSFAVACLRFSHAPSGLLRR